MRDVLFARTERAGAAGLAFGSGVRTGVRRLRRHLPRVSEIRLWSLPHTQVRRECWSTERFRPTSNLPSGDGVREGAVRCER
jgi:hypothetical protein